MKINENELAKKVAKREGGQTKVNIAQIKEVGACYFEELAICLKSHGASEVLALIEKHAD